LVRLGGLKLRRFFSRSTVTITNITRWKPVFLGFESCTYYSSWQLFRTTQSVKIRVLHDMTAERTQVTFLCIRIFQIKICSDCKF
uniref:Secreted protein n=1 Tax=Hymenolepis diminuta TaxID=6216 RepID=A0A0R3SFH2_HYMDI